MLMEVLGNQGSFMKNLGKLKKIFKKTYVTVLVKLFLFKRRLWLAFSPGLA